MSSELEDKILINMKEINFLIISYNIKRFINNSVKFLTGFFWLCKESYRYRNNNTKVNEIRNYIYNQVLKISVEIIKHLENQISANNYEETIYYYFEFLKIKLDELDVINRHDNDIIINTYDLQCA